MTRRHAITIVLLVSGTARGDTGTAEQLMTQADKVIKDGGCTTPMGNCKDPDAFVAALETYDRAFAEDPTPAAAAHICGQMERLGKQASDTLIARGGLWRALARCDFAAYHADADAPTRGKGANAGHSLRMKLQASRSAAENDARMAAAARALFGVGLSVSRDAASGKVSIARGELTPALIQEYSAEYWSDHARRAWPDFAAEKRDTQALGEKGIMGWALAEPASKLKICLETTRLMQSGVSEMQRYCKLQAVIEANARLYAFRGEAVTYEEGEGRVAPDERIFVPGVDGVYPALVTVAGPAPIDDQAHIALQRTMIGQLFRGESGEEQAKAAALAARGEKIAGVASAKLKAAEAKIAGRGGVVVFGEGSFFSWELPPLVAKGQTADCGKLSYKVYPPAAGDHEAEIQVDGETCSVFPLSSPSESDVPNANWLAQPDPAHDVGNNLCPPKLALAGTHTVVVTMYRLGAQRTGNKVISEDLKIRDEWHGVRGKRVAGATAQCLTR